MIKYKIILPTFSNYLAVTENFLSLLQINWPDAMSSVVISVIGSKKKWINKFNVDVFENPSNCTLPGCIKSVTDKYKADLYLSFLGDAFITKKVNKQEVTRFINEIINKNIEYCRLVPQFNLQELHSRFLYRRLSNRERYGHSFVAFACTKKFINTEFSNDISDRDFEVNYLKLTEKKKYFYLNRAIISKNIFNIFPCIQKGKWDLIEIRKLRKKYPTIAFANLEEIGYCYEFIIIARKLILPFLPNNIIKVIKLKIKKRREYFDTDY